MLLKKNGNIKENVSIKDQCSKNNFYLNKKIEKQFSNIEGKHKNTIEILNEINSIGEFNALKEEQYNLIYQMVLFQQARTKDFLNDIKTISKDYANTILQQEIKYGKLRHKLKEIEGVNDDNIHEILNSVTIDIPNPSLKNTMNSNIASVFLRQETIKDLKIYILNNKTNKEFIFSDNPTVFYNLAYVNYNENSMTAMQSPGLINFYPISRFKCLLLLDEECYRGSIINNYFFDITQETDINIINKLQIHNSLDTVYASDLKQIKYTKKLYKQERNRLGSNKDYVTMYNNIIKVIPKKIKFITNLSFIQSKKIKNRTFRNKELYNLLELSSSVMKKMEDIKKSYIEHKDSLNEPYDEIELNNLMKEIYTLKKNQL